MTAQVELQELGRNFPGIKKKQIEYDRAVSVTQGGQIFEGSFSVVLKPNFASKYPFETARRDLLLSFRLDYFELMSCNLYVRVLTQILVAIFVLLYNVNYVFASPFNCSTYIHQPPFQILLFHAA